MMDRMISSFRKASSRVVWAYSLCIVILAFGSYLIGGNVAPKNIFIVTWMFLCIDIVSTVFLFLDGNKNWARMPFWIKKLISMPFLLAIAVTGIMNFGEVKGNLKTNLTIVVLCFGIGYLVSSMIVYFIVKKQTDKMNDALSMIQKEIAKEDE